MTQLKSKVGAAWSRLTQYLGVFSERFDRGPIAGVARFSQFIETRAAYIAQTSLYGYLKTRMGTSFPKYFQDEVFSHSIHISAVKVFVSCLSDMAVFAVGTAKVRSDLKHEEAVELAVACFDASMANYLSAKDLLVVPSDSLPQFRRRAEITAWATAAEGENAFHGSADDLVRYAPVIDEYRKADAEIVHNSIRFRWREARAELRKRLDGPSVVADWRSGSRPVISPPAATRQEGEARGEG